MLILTAKRVLSHRRLSLSRTIMSSTLPPTISQGILNLAGSNSQSKAVAERLLEEDRNVHHCFWGKVGFHNHLSHQ